MVTNMREVILTLKTTHSLKNEEEVEEEKGYLKDRYINAKIVGKISKNIKLLKDTPAIIRSKILSQ
jgi:hypothetical protein